MFLYFFVNIFMSSTTASLEVGNLIFLLECLSFKTQLVGKGDR